MLLEGMPQLLEVSREDEEAAGRIMRSCQGVRQLAFCSAQLCWMCWQPCQAEGLQRVMRSWHGAAVLACRICCSGNRQQLNPVVPITTCSTTWRRRRWRLCPCAAHVAPDFHVQPVRLSFTTCSATWKRRRWKRWIPRIPPACPTRCAVKLLQSVGFELPHPACAPACVVGWCALCRQAHVHMHLPPGGACVRHASSPVP